jgi:hypothetical protein
MAITRSQQAKQMLQNGGGANPPKLGNPPVIEEIENMREFRIANPNIKNIFDLERELKKKLQRERARKAALNTILYRFGGKFDRPTSSGDSLEDMITELNLADVLKYDFQGPAGVMGLEEALNMITPKSVSTSARKIQRDISKADGGRIGLQGGGADLGAGASGMGSGNTGGDNEGNTARETGIMSRGLGPMGTTGNIGDFVNEGPLDKGTKEQNLTQDLVIAGFTPNQIRRATQGPNLFDKFRASRFNNPVTRGAIRLGLYTINPTVIGLDARKALALKDIYDSYKETDLDEDDLRGPDAFAGGGIVNLDTNKLAVKLLADGGFIDDEERQAYGLGSIVRKITRPVKKAVKKVTGTVKKIVKSPVGRTALALAAVYATRNPKFLASLSQAQKAALISAATTAGTQVASGEDLDLKEIGASAALSAGLAKAFPVNAQTDMGVTSDAGFRSTDALGGEYLAGGDLPAKEIIGATAGAGDTGTIIARNIPESTDLLQSAKDFVTTPSTARTLLALGLPSVAAGLMTPEQKEFESEDDFRGEGIDIPEYRRDPFGNLAIRFRAEGGSTESKEPVAKKVMPLLDMDGMEKDYRETGGFVPIGRMEKADDVPARLSKNEFVFTADAVRNAGDGDVDKGSEVMYNMMKNLEAGGKVSEESQGLKGARKMFQTSKRLEEVL